MCPLLCQMDTLQVNDHPLARTELSQAQQSPASHGVKKKLQKRKKCPAQTCRLSGLALELWLRTHSHPDPQGCSHRTEEGLAKWPETPNPSV
jgi:hypothetical protein